MSFKNALAIEFETKSMVLFLQHRVRVEKTGLRVIIEPTENHNVRVEGTQHSCQSLSVCVRYEYMFKSALSIKNIVILPLPGYELLLGKVAAIL